MRLLLPRSMLLHRSYKFIYTFSQSFMARLALMVNIWRPGSVLKMKKPSRRIDLKAVWNASRDIILDGIWLFHEFDLLIYCHMARWIRTLIFPGWIIVCRCLTIFGQSQKRSMVGVLHVVLQLNDIPAV